MRTTTQIDADIDRLRRSIKRRENVYGTGMKSTQDETSFDQVRIASLINERKEIVAVEHLAGALAQALEQIEQLLDNDHVDEDLDEVVAAGHDALNTYRRMKK